MIAIGEVKSGETIGMRHLVRLQHAVELLRAQRKISENAHPVLLLFTALASAGN